MCLYARFHASLWQVSSVLAAYAPQGKLRAREVRPPRLRCPEWRSVPPGRTTDLLLKEVDRMIKLQLYGVKRAHTIAATFAQF